MQARYKYILQYKVSNDVNNKLWTIIKMLTKY